MLRFGLSVYISLFQCKFSPSTLSQTCKGESLGLAWIGGACLSETVASLMKLEVNYVSWRQRLPFKKKKSYHDYDNNIVLSYLFLVIIILKGLNYSSI